MGDDLGVGLGREGVALRLQLAPQVAEILDTSVSAVETLLVRARQSLRQALGHLIE